MAKIQKIKYNNKGAYLTYHCKRIYLYEVIKSNSNGDDIAKVYHYGANSPYKVCFLGFDDDGDAVGMVEFIKYY
jgi:hypothetical protein